MSIALRSYWRSSCSWRVRIALHFKGLSFDTIPVHLVADGGQQHSVDHRAVNPMREVPVLQVDDVAFGQSIAILEYLEEQYPTPALLPSEPISRARVRQLAEVVNSGIQPIQNLRVMQQLGKDLGAEKAQQVAWSRYWITFGFEALSALVAEFGGTYCVGDAISFADLCLVPQLYNARRFGVELDRFENLTAIEARLENHPAFRAAHPDNQPDAPSA